MQAAHTAGTSPHLLFVGVDTGHPVSEYCFNNRSSVLHGRLHCLVEDSLSKTSPDDDSRRHCIPRLGQSPATDDVHQYIPTAIVCSQTLLNRWSSHRSNFRGCLHAQAGHVECYRVRCCVSASTAGRVATVASSANRCDAIRLSSVIREDLGIQRCNKDGGSRAFSAVKFAASASYRQADTASVSVSVHDSH